jgi:hypothetical protein
MTMQLLVIDGADQGQTFLLPQADTVLIGSSKKHAYICLHDLYVARVHCQVEVKGQSVMVTAHESPGGTLVNGAKVTHKELQLGDVVRVGNSHLRLQISTEAAPHAPARPATHQEPAKPAALPHLPAAKLEQLSGHLLGHFDIGEVLGKRHWGVVFRARDLKKNQDVALRVLADFPANDQEMQNFSRVLRGVLPMRHPHIVALQGAGKTGPYGWIAMEHIEGECLTPVIERLAAKSKIKWKRSLRVGVHIARALEFTHQRHMFHGHITPGNVLIQDSDQAVKLNDLVLHQAVAGSESAHNLAEERWQDNLLYRSPEQTYPDSIVDDLSDQYALGVLIYALLTGRRPFEGATPEETVSLIRQSTPVKPTELQPSIPMALQALVLKMLAKRQEDRYATPTDLLAELEKIAAAHGEVV